MSVSLIWAEARGGVIGDGGSIPWHVPEDMAHFREMTRGHPVVMGRRTWDSLPERFRPLPGRRNIVVTRRDDWAADGAERAASVAEALQQARTGHAEETDVEVWVIGGGEVYAQALPLADRLEVTELDLDVPGDTRAPQLDDDIWQRAGEGEWQESRTGIRYRFTTRRRR